MKGWHKFPLKPNSKVPATPNGVLDATPDFEPKETENYGTRTGKESGILVLDVDNKPGASGWESLTELEALPETFTVATPSGGAHFYFQYPPSGEYRNRVGIRPGLDIRGDNGYVVGPGSRLDNGEYVVTTDAEPAPCPQWLLELMQERKPALDVVASDGVVEGGRNDYLFRVASKLQRSDLLTFDGLMAVNDEKCSPPLGEREVRRIYDNAMRYQPEEDLTVDLAAEPILATPDAERRTLYVNDLIEPMLSALEDTEAVSGLSSGFPGLDKLMGGGLFRKGNLIGALAESGSGKTTLLNSLIAHGMAEGRPWAFASQEMRPHDEVLPALVSIATGENLWTADAERKRELAKCVTPWHLGFTEKRGRLPGQELLTWIRTQADQGIKFFGLDHLHHTLEDVENYREATKITQDIKALVDEYDLYFVLLLQPTKPPPDFKRLQPHHVRGGNGIREALDTMLILERYKVHGEEVPCTSTLRIEKKRHALARLGKIYLQYNSTTTAYTETGNPTENAKGPIHNPLDDILARAFPPAPKTEAEKLVEEKM